MNFTDTHKAIVAAAGIAALTIGGYRYFLPRTEAAEQIAAVKAEAKATEQKVAKTVDQLRAEVLLARVKQLNEKAKLTEDEKLERELNVKQVMAIQAASVAK